MRSFPLRKLMISAAGLLLLASCSKKNEQGKWIPKDATVVIALDGKSLSSKLSWDEIKKNPLFEEMRNDSSMPATLKTLMEHPDSSGIDIETDCFAFVIKDSVGGYIGVEGKVKNENTFQSFNRVITQNGVESEANGAHFISKAPYSVGWTNDKFVYIFDIPKMAQMDELSRRMMADSIDISTRTPRDIGATCKAIFTLDESASLAKNEKFSTLMGEKGDVRFWVNSEQLIKANGTNPAMMMTNLDKFYKGSVTTATLDFEKGKMNVQGSSYGSGELMDIFKKYSGGSISEDMIKRMPGKDVVALMAVNFKPEALHAIIKMTGMDGLMNVGISKLGFTIDDFIKANKGDILVGVSDLSMKSDTQRFKFQDQEEHVSISDKPHFNFIFSASIGDKESFNKLINAAKKFGGEQMSDPSKAPVAFNSNANLFVLSNTQANADQYLQSANGSFDFISKINGKPFGGYVNMQSVQRAFQGEAKKDSTAQAIFDASIALWDNILWKGGDYSNGAIHYTAEINLVDKNTNSLKQLNEYAAKLSNLYRQKKKERQMAMDEMPEMVDTATIMAPKAK